MPDKEKEQEKEQAEGQEDESKEEKEDSMPDGLDSPIAKLINDKLKAFPEEGKGRLPGRKEILSELKEVEGSDALLSGKITFPNDEQMEAVAQTFGMDLNKLRQGAVDGMTEDDSEDMPEPEPEKSPDGKENEGSKDEVEMSEGEPEVIENSAQKGCTDCDCDSTIRELKEEVARYELQSQVPELGEDKTETLIQLKAKDEDAFQDTLEILSSNQPEPEQTEVIENSAEPEGERISSPGTPPSNSTSQAEMIKLYEQAQEQGKTSGAELVKFMRKRGKSHDPSIAEKVFSN